MIEKVKIKNINVYAFPNRQLFLDYIEYRKTILIAINAEKILVSDVKLHRIINENIAYPDGEGAVMALKQKGLKAVKIPGAELWLDIINRFYKNRSFYLLGGSPNVIISTVEKLRKEFPGINIVGYSNGYFKENEKEIIVGQIKGNEPDIVFVAQGSPKQEFLMDELIKIHPAIYMGLGGSFDVYCGLKKRAPNFFLRFKIEWLYRLLKEPTRISRQLKLIKYLVLYKLGKL